MTLCVSVCVRLCVHLQIKYIYIYMYRIRIQCTYTYFSLPHCAEGLRKSQKSFGRRKKGGGKFSGRENFQVALPFARKVGWGWDDETSVGRRGGEGQNFLRLRRASSYCVAIYSRTTHAHAHTHRQTHTPVHRFLSLLFQSLQCA